MVRYCGRVVHFVEWHHVLNYLLIDVSLAVTPDQVHENVNGPACLIAKDLACRDVVCRHDVGWLVLLHVSEFAASLLKFAFEYVYEGRIKARKDTDHCWFFVLGLWYPPKDTVNEVVRFFLSSIQLLFLIFLIDKHCADLVEKFLGLGLPSTFKAEPASLR